MPLVALGLKVQGAKTWHVEFTKDIHGLKLLRNSAEVWRRHKAEGLG